jgi:putative tryptophan/tyrosine transport system substrate-binding protein
VRKREFLTLLGGFAAWPWPQGSSVAQQSVKVPIVGFIGSGTPSTYSQRVSAFQHRLRELDRVEGRNVAIEYRWAEGATNVTLKSRPRLSGSKSMSS